MKKAFVFLFATISTSVFAADIACTKVSGFDLGEIIISGNPAKFIMTGVSIDGEKRKTRLANVDKDLIYIQNVQGKKDKYLLRVVNRKITKG
jgi:hypothetical protein